MQLSAPWLSSLRFAAGRIVAKAMRRGNRLPVPACGEGVGVRGFVTPDWSARDRDFLIGTCDRISLGRGEAMVDLGCCHWPAEAVALHRMHAGGAQEQMLIGGLNAFRRHLHAETAAEADDGMNDGRSIGGLLDRAHETRIDLELVEWKTPQIKQARVAGAEIVERKTHADAFEPASRVPRFRDCRA